MPFRPPLRARHMDNAGLTCISSVPDDVKLQNAIPSHSTLAAEVLRDGGYQFRCHRLSQGDGILPEDDALSQHRGSADLAQRASVVAFNEADTLDAPYFTIRLRLRLRVLVPGFPLGIRFDTAEAQR